MEEQRNEWRSEGINREREMERGMKELNRKINEGIKEWNQGMNERMKE